MKLLSVIVVGLIGGLLLLRGLEHLLFQPTGVAQVAIQLLFGGALVAAAVRLARRSRQRLDED